MPRMIQMNPIMRNRAEKGSTKVTVELQTSEPFMILFKEVPNTLIEFKDVPASRSTGCTLPVIP